jgi:hypothetical protein
MSNLADNPYFELFRDMLRQIDSTMADKDSEIQCLKQEIEKLYFRINTIEDFILDLTGKDIPLKPRSEMPAVSFANGADNK